VKLLIYFETANLKNYETNLAVSFIFVYIIVWTRLVWKKILGKFIGKAGYLESKNTIVAPSVII